MSNVRSFVWGLGLILVIIGIVMGMAWALTGNHTYEPACFVFVTIGGLLMTLAATR